MRLDRLLGLLGIATRTAAKDLIREGRVQVDGQLVLDNRYQVTEASQLVVDGVPVDARTTRHLMMNKPSGVLTAATDHNTSTVVDLLPPVYRTLGCMPVGRLDKDTEGLLLFTTDGQLAHRLLAPALGVEKEYVATVSGTLTQRDVEAFAQGLHLGDFNALPAILNIVSSSDDLSTARVTVHEGKFHQVKRMFAATGHTVQTLKRVRFGPLQLDEALSPGAYRELTPEEAQSLYESVQSL